MASVNLVSYDELLNVLVLEWDWNFVSLNWYSCFCFPNQYMVEGGYGRYGGSPKHRRGNAALTLQVTNTCHFGEVTLILG